MPAVMVGSDDEQVQGLARRIEVELACATGHVRRLRRQNAWLGYTGIFAGAVATLLAGGAATTGAIGGQWATTCGVVALRTACGTVASGLQRQLGIMENLTRATACAGKLDALRVALTVTRRELREVAIEYERLVEGNREFLS